MGITRRVRAAAAAQAQQQEIDRSTGCRLDDLGDRVRDLERERCGDRRETGLRVDIRGTLRGRGMRIDIRFGRSEVLV